jgi:hypothetical protein
MKLTAIVLATAAFCFGDTEMAFAKTKAQAAKGLRCDHFSNSLYIGLSTFTAAERRSLRRGQVFWVNVPDLGRVRCKVV